MLVAVGLFLASCGDIADGDGGGAGQEPILPTGAVDDDTPVAPRSLVDSEIADASAHAPVGSPCRPTVAPAPEADERGLLGGGSPHDVPDLPPLPDEGWCRTDWTWEELCAAQKSVLYGPDDPCPQFWSGLGFDEGCGWQSAGTLSDLPLDAILPNRPPDWIELRNHTEDPEGQAPELWCGTRCLTAADPGACGATLATLNAYGHIPPFCEDCFQRNLIVNYGDASWVLDEQSFPEFIGAVDSHTDAILYAQLAGYFVIHTWDGAPGSVLRVGSGWLLVAVKPVVGDWIRDDRVLLHLSLDGRITELRSNVQFLKCKSDF